jgi:hypothetical protein
MRRWSGPTLNTAQQLVNLRINPISRGHGEVRRGKLTWDFELQPDPLARIYRVRIEYQESSAPRIYVLAPNLSALATGRKIPHLYEQDPARLCLYLPGTGEWSPSKKISDTIVPWTFLWLRYFEDWLASGEWKGGGVHPTVRRPPGRRTPSDRKRPSVD